MINGQAFQEIENKQVLFIGKKAQTLECTNFKLFLYLWLPCEMKQNKEVQ